MNSSNRKLHVVVFDVPYPPNYGGVVDVFYKLKALQNEGIQLTLHCFEYGRGKQKELETICNQVYYYKRKTGLLGLQWNKPYIVSSRRGNALLNNLLQDDAPILFEGIHTTYYLNHPQLQHRFKVLRAHNIEHLYYKNLAEKQSYGFKKWYFQREQKLLEIYENQLHDLQSIACIAAHEVTYFEHKAKQVFHLPAFHQEESVSSKTGRGTYCLYHGNLEIKENEDTALYLCKEVFSKVDYPLIVAGKNPSEQLKAFESNNIHIKSNPSEDELHELIQDAHIHVLPALDANGIKLKLLYALHAGRFCIVNHTMLAGSGIDRSVLVANTTEELIQTISTYAVKFFTEEDIEERKHALKNYRNDENAQRLIHVAFPS
ncbi:MAG: glycosyltransferase [Chitinophagaceae bacterium]|nr:glycosyltransferase [Chitinophagaceae bacterium]